MNNFLSVTDFILFALYLVIIYFFAKNYQRKHIEQNKYYKYFVNGLLVKIFGGFLLSMIYVYYYKGGDTLYYFWGTEVIYKMMFKNFDVFIRLIIGDHSQEIYSYFDSSTGYPTYFRDQNAWAVCRFTFPFYILGAKSYLATMILLSSAMYIGIWKFFEFVVTHYKLKVKYFAWAIFFLPSVALWSSGIMKDTYTFTAVFTFITAFHRVVFLKHKIISNILILILWSYIMLSIRAYLFYLIMACCLLWVGYLYVNKIKNSVIRIAIFPIVLLIMVFLGAFIINKVSDSVGGKYTVDNLLMQAWIIQDDLSRDYYGENSFNIGSFEPTIPGILSKAHLAVIAGFFRPFLWEANNFLMVFSGIENLALLLFILFVIFKNGIIYSFSKILQEPFFLTCLVFSLVFAFMVGLTTANFGALVRYRIPIIPTILIVLSAIHYKKENTTDN